MRYPGGKGKCFQHLINMMPPHGTYIESHLGGGAVLRNKAAAKHSIGIDKDPRVIAAWRDRYPNLCELVQGDSVEFLCQRSFNGNELIYADPPYLHTTRRGSRLYSCEYTTEDHEQLLGVLARLPCMVMLSGYDSELYNDMLIGWRKETFFAKSHTDVREEHVWLNFPPPRRLHDSGYVGSTFRERQQIKRRQLRLRGRIQSMNAPERNELLQWLYEMYENDISEIRQCNMA
jgi:DNA adenine methylase